MMVYITLIRGYFFDDEENIVEKAKITRYKRDSLVVGLSLLVVGFAAFGICNLNFNMQSLKQTTSYFTKPAISSTELPYYGVWNRTWAGPQEDFGTGIWSNGSSIYTCGYNGSLGAGATNTTHLVKWDSNGNQVWNRTWGYGYSEQALAVTGCKTTIFTCGSMTNATNRGDLFLVRWDSNGNQSWNRTWGGSDGTDRASGIWCNQTCVYTCGYTTSYGLGATNGDLLLVKWDWNGIRLWNHTFGGNDTDLAYSVWCDGASVYTCGSTRSFGTAGTDMLLVKWDGNGNFQWKRTWGGTGYDEGDGVSGDGTAIYTCGYTNSFGAGNDDLMLVKWDPSGNQVWSRTWGGTGNDDGKAVVVNGTSIYTGGYTASFGLTAFYSLLAKWDSSGNCLWSSMYGNGSVSYMTSSMCIAGPNIYMCGDSQRRYTGYYDLILDKWSGNVAPAITSPADIPYVASTTGHSISWTITDDTTGRTSYMIYRNGTRVSNGTWSSGVAVSINVDGLGIGKYNYTIVASDGVGGSVQDTVLVTVTPATNTEFLLLLILVIIIAIIIIVILVLLEKKRRSRKKKPAVSEKSKET